jgi:hypothetical protein
VILLEWSEFAERLSRELAGLDRDTILIVREHDESRHYVQAMREPDRLYAEAVSNNFLEGPLALTPADEEVLTEAGWRPPTEDWAPANWWTELPPFATAPDFTGLADMMVTALRDVQGLRRPADLVYESFHRHGTGLIELLDFGITPADPGRISESRRTSDVPRPGAGEDPSGEDTGDEAGNVVPEPDVHEHGQSAGERPERTGRRRRATEAAALSAPSGPDRPKPPSGDLDGATAATPAGGPPSAEALEARLAKAKERGDHLTCFELLLSAELTLSMTRAATEDQAAEFATTSIGNGTYLMAFTSTEAMAEALGEQAGGNHVASFGELAAAWPNPRWSLVINLGLPSEIHLDSATVARLDGMRRTAEQASTVDAVVDVPAPAPPAVRLWHGARLWRYEGESEAPVAVYDSVTARWDLTAPQAD